MSRGVLGLVGVGVLVVATAGCGGSSGGSGVEGGIPASELKDALQLVPAKFDSVRFTNQQLGLKEMGFPDATGKMVDDRAKMASYSKKATDSSYAVDLASWIYPMQSWGWNALDVQWEAAASDVGAPPMTIDKMRPGLDMQVVIDSLIKRGYQRSGPKDAPHFKLPRSKMTSDDTVIPLALGVTVVPGKHLVVMSGDDTSVATGSGSFATKPVVRTVAQGAADAGVVTMATGKAACANPRAGSPASMRVVHPDKLKKVQGWSAAETGKLAGRVTVAYPDAKTASADKSARSSLIASGTDPIQSRPYRDLFTANVAEHGSTLGYSLKFKRPALLLRMTQQADTPWAFCPGSSGGASDTPTS